MIQARPGHAPSPAPERRPLREDLLLELSQRSTLLTVLRALYSLMLDYGVYLPDDGDPIVFSKDQVVGLVERGRSEAMIKDLPALAEEGLFRPVATGDLEDAGDTIALTIERLGGRLSTVAEAADPSGPPCPAWWDAPIPFAMCTRKGMRLNETATVMFGRDLDRLVASALPEKDEFIVELEGKGRPCFLSFRRLEPHIFTIDDCTSELMEAQDISWWAAVGRAWAGEIEASGRTWRREPTKPTGPGRVWPCEWQGRFQGWLVVEGGPVQGPTLPEPMPQPDGRPAPSDAEEPEPKKRKRRATAKPKKEDEVLKALGPQTMGLLAAGMSRDGEDAPDDDPPTRRPRGRSRKAKAVDEA